MMENLKWSYTLGFRLIDFWQSECPLGILNWDNYIGVIFSRKVEIREQLKGYGKIIKELLLSKPTQDWIYKPLNIYFK